MGGGAGADFAPNLRRETISLIHLPPLGKPEILPPHPPLKALSGDFVSWRKSWNVTCAIDPPFFQHHMIYFPSFVLTVLGFLSFVPNYFQLQWIFSRIISNFN